MMRGLNQQALLDERSPSTCVACGAPLPARARFTCGDQDCLRLWRAAWNRDRYAVTTKQSRRRRVVAAQPIGPSRVQLTLDCGHVCFRLRDAYQNAICYECRPSALRTCPSCRGTFPGNGFANHTRRCLPKRLAA